MSYYAVFNVSTDINPILGEKCVKSIYNTYSAYISAVHILISSTVTGHKESNTMRTISISEKECVFL